MNKIIDDPSNMAKLSDQELDDLINDGKYNLPNLRELVRRCIKDLRDYIEYSKHLYEQNQKLRNLILNANSWNEEIVKMQKKLKDI